MGRKLRRDHIPWATLTPAELAAFGYLRTTGVDLATILALVWRVRTWKISGSASVSGTTTFLGVTSNVTSSFDIPEHQMPLKTIALIDPDATVEQQIVGVPSVSQNNLRGLRSGGFIGHLSQDVPETSTLDADDGTHEGGTTSQLLETNDRLLGHVPDFELVSVDAGTGLFYPKIDSEVLMRGRFCQVRTKVVSAGSNGTLTVIPGIVPTITFPLAVTMPIIGTFEATTTSGSVSMTMTAIKFWQYRNRLGQFVYDEDSGAQINDPHA